MEEEARRAQRAAAEERARREERTRYEQGARYEEEGRKAARPVPEAQDELYQLLLEGGPFAVSLDELLKHVQSSVGRPRRLLGLPLNEQPTAKAVRERYKVFASRIHPDKIPKGGEHLNAQAEEAFKVLHSAFEVLTV